MISTVQDVTALIQTHAAFAGLLGFVVAFFGSFLGTNLIVPAGSVLTAMGVLMGAGVIPWTILVWAACGAALGMTACYAFGQYFGDRVQQIPLLKNRPEFMRRAKAIFEKHGFLSILIGYFSGPLRAPIACIAGIADMGRLRFELANLSSAFIWSAVAIGIGAAPGAIIEPDSIWLLIAPVLVPAVMVGLSAAVYYFRSKMRR
ncbi:membrane-associated protein [Nitrobacteraceae bacterium AZCC 2146]